jgi:hypothetical protein
MRRLESPYWTKALRVLLLLAASSCGDGPTDPVDKTAHLEFTVQPSLQGAGEALAPAVEVTVKDANGFRIFDANTQVTLALTSNPSGATLSGPVSIRAQGGVAVFDQLTIDKVGSGYVLTATASTAQSATSAAFDIGPGAPGQLIITADPSDVVAGEVITPPVEVTVLDAFGNLATDAAVQVTLELSAPAPLVMAARTDEATAAAETDSAVTTPARSAALDSPTLHGTTTVTAVDGIVTFDNVWVDMAASGYTFTARAGDIASPASASFTTAPAAPAQLGFQTQPSDGPADTWLAPVQVAIQDTYGNLVTTATAAVTVALGSNPSGATLSGTKTRNAVAGIATFDDLSIDKAANGYRLTASASGLSNVLSQSFAIGAGEAAQLRFRTQPSDGTAFAVITPPIQVEILDAFGNLLTSATHTVTIAIGSNPGGGTLAGTNTRQAVDGVATFDDLSIDRAGSGYTLVATAAAMAGATSDEFYIGEGTASQLQFRTQPGIAIAGEAIEPPIEVGIYDALGNLVSSAQGAVTISLGANPTSGTLSGTLTVDAVNGIATFDDLWIDKSGTGYRLLASSPGLSNVTSNLLTIAPAAATRFVIMDPTDVAVPGPARATVRAMDQFGNVATGENRDVTLVASGFATGAGLVNMAGGIGSLLISDEVAETVRLSLEDTQGTGLDVSATQDVVFRAGLASKFVVLDPPDGPVQSNITVTVQAQDRFGNLSVSEDRDVTLVTSGSATGGGLVNIQSGVGTRQITNTIPETVTLSLTDTEGTGLDVSSTAQVVFTATAATRFVIVDPADGTVDGPIVVTVRALDQFGNLATGENRAVTLLSTGSATDGLVDFYNGIGTILVYDQVAETVTLSLVDTQGTGVDVSSTQSVVFATGAVAKFTIVDPSDGPIQTPITVTVRAEDQYGNLVTSENRDVTLVTSGSATGGGLVDIQNGSGTRQINDDVPEIVTLSLLDTESTSLNVSSTQTVVFTAGGAVRFVIVDPSDGTVDDPILVTVRALDQFGNVATGENRGVTLRGSGSAIGGFVDIYNGQGTVLVYDEVAQTVTLSLLDTEVTGLDVSSTQTVVFAPGAVAKFAILDPADGTVQNPVTVTVQAQDQFGNLVASENRDVTLVTSGSATGGGLVDIQNGVGTRQISDAVPETVTLSLQDTQLTGLNVSSTQTVVFAAGGATRYVILEPTNGTVDGPIVVTVHALDQYGNIATGENRGVMLLSTGSASGGFVDVYNGIGTILIYDQVAETVTLSLLDTQGTGLDVSSTRTVVFGPGVVNKFTIVDPPDGIIQNPITVTVRAEDQYGNLVTSENRDVTLLTSGSATGGGLVNIQNGSGTRQINDDVPETVTLSLSDTEGTGLNVSSTQTVVFSAGTATRFVIVDPADGTVDNPILVTVRALDQFGNVATSENRGVTLLASGSAYGGYVDIYNGVGTMLVFDDVAETVTLSLVDTELTGLDVSSTQTVVFGPGVGARFVILDPTDGTIGTPVTVTVQAQDQYGNLVTSENRDVTLLTSGSATGGGLVNIQSGSGSLQINDNVPETVTLSLSDTQGTGLNVSSTQTVVFAAGAATRFVIVDPPDGTVDNPILVTVRALDASGNVATSENRGVTLVASGSAFGDFVDIYNGIGTTLVYDEVAETVTLSLLDTQGTGLDVSSTQTVVFAAGAVNKFTILDPLDGVVGTPITVTVQAQDQHGNVVTSENRDVTLVTSGSATGGGLVDIQNGSGTRQINDNLPEIVTLSLSDTQGTGLNVSSTQTVTFSAAAATQFVIVDPADGTVDNPILVTVRALDQYGNVATSENRGVTLVASGSAVGDFVDIYNGIGTVMVYDDVPETVTLSLLDTQGTGLDVSSTQQVVFGVGAAARYVILDPADGQVGTPITVTVQAQDQYGNLATTVSGSVTLVTTGSATGGGSLTISGGSGTININDTVAETVTLTLSNPSPALNVSSTQTVVFAAVATRFVILDPPDGTVGTPLTVTVQAQDNSGTVITSENRDVTLVTSGSATGGGLVNIQNGVGTRQINDAVAETVTLSLTDTEETGLNTGSTQTVVFSIVATRFVILDPADGPVNTAITVTVQAQDQYGNLATNENRDVTLVTSGSATGGGLVNIQNGVGTRQINDAVAETVTLSLTDTEETGLNTGSTQAVVFSIVATRFVILDPADGTVGTAIPVTVQAQDQYGNLDTTVSGSVTLVTTGSATGGGLVGISGGTGTISINDTVAETVTLSLSGPSPALDVSSTEDVVFSAADLLGYTSLLRLAEVAR